jgi:hypothetical protein
VTLQTAQADDVVFLGLDADGHGVFATDLSGDSAPVRKTGDKQDKDGRVCDHQCMTWPGGPKSSMQTRRNRGGKGARRQNPKAVVFISLALALSSFGSLIFTATVLSAAASKSGYTQAHGLLRSGIVTSVANADIGVRLGKPVNGQAATTAHVHPPTSLKPGAAVRVLVDPKDPGYAEFPGQRYTQEFAAQLGAAASLAIFAVSAFMAAWWGRVWYRQRR